MALAIRSIQQKGPHEFSIVWQDGVENKYRLSELQKKCPCALCASQGVADSEVKATKVTGVGRYAIRIFFTSGCSNGIYDYDFLYSFKSL